MPISAVQRPTAADLADAFDRWWDTVEARLCVAPHPLRPTAVQQSQIALFARLCRDPDRVAQTVTMLLAGVLVAAACREPVPLGAARHLTRVALRQR
jgi:hypothetical protein